MINDELKFEFPDGFLWGASTSAHQIEGGLYNDWSEWEKSEKRIKQLQNKGFSTEDFISGQACNSWNMLTEDIECIKKLNLNAYRFSVDWSRIEPRDGEFDMEAIARYKNFVDELIVNGIEPFVTIWHWPVPIWLRDQGAWENKKTIRKFIRLSAKLVKEMPRVKYWITLNEPEVLSGNSYIKAKWPPQKRNPIAYWRVWNNLITAHRLAYATMKEQNPQLMIGIAKHNIHFEAKDNKIFNRILKWCSDWWFNYFILNKINDSQDFIGLNHYFHSLIDGWYGKNKNEKISDIGWELYPESLYYTLNELKKFNKPIFITENGLADEHDSHRQWFIEESLKSVCRAINEGIDVKGYLHWSLLDNFEWAEGFGPKFGLYSVDRETFVRTPRSSALRYAEICKNNKF